MLIILVIFWCVYAVVHKEPFVLALVTVFVFSMILLQVYTLGKELEEK